MKFYSVKVTKAKYIKIRPDVGIVGCIIFIAPRSYIL